MADLLTLLERAQPAATANAGSTAELADAPAMAPTLLSALICQHDAADPLTGMHTAQRIHYSLAAGRLPHPATLMLLTFWWFRAPGETTLKIRLLAPDGQELASSSERVTVGPQQAPLFFCHRVRFVDPGQLTISLPQAGLYRIEVWQADRPMGAYPLALSLVEPRSEA